MVGVCVGRNLVLFLLEKDCFEKTKREVFAYQSLLSNTTEAQYSLYVVCAKQIFSFPPTLAARGENDDFSTKKMHVREDYASSWRNCSWVSQYQHSVFQNVLMSESSKHESIKEVSCPLIFLISNTHEIHIFKFFRTVILG